MTTKFPNIRATLQEVGLTLGIEQNTTSHREKWISALGGFCGIGLCYLFSRLWLDSNDAAMVVASAGASAVLIFAVPHGALSQIWPVFGGHLISALIGVSCQQLPLTTLAAPLAVGLAIIAMYYLRCLHPPGGATALFAVIGGDSIHALGYSFVLYPILINVSALLICGIAFNSLFSWRRYPGHLFRQYRSDTEAANDFDWPISQEDLAVALQEMNSFIDITPDDLSDLLIRASASAKNRGLPSDRYLVGRCYSNGQRGDHWEVRRIVAINKTRISFRTVANAQGAYGEEQSTQYSSARDFKRWARHELHWLQENQPLPSAQGNNKLAS